MFPFSVKQQKSMASQAKVQKKVKELQKIYANDKMKLNEEVQKLYQKEGVSMSGGCLTMLIPYPILLGIYHAVLYPLRNAAAHQQRERRQRGDARLLDSDPRPWARRSSRRTARSRSSSIFRLCASISPCSPADDISKIESFSHGFKFLGLDLLATPASSSFFHHDVAHSRAVPLDVARHADHHDEAHAHARRGDAAAGLHEVVYTQRSTGFYWIIQNILGVGQSIVTRAFFGQEILVAKGEAARIARRELEEAKVKALPADQQIELRRRLEAKLGASGKQPAREEKKQLPAEKKSAPAQKGKAKAGKGGSEYLGRKK